MSLSIWIHIDFVSFSFIVSTSDLVANQRTLDFLIMAYVFEEFLYAILR